MTKTQKAQRYFVYQVLTHYNILIAHLVHQFYLIATRDSAGLTPKERQYLLNRHEELKTIMGKNRKLIDRLRKTSPWPAMTTQDLKAERESK